MGLLRQLRSLTSNQRSTFSACFLGWTMDAFDFFLLTVCLKAISQEFHVGIKQIAEAIFWTLVMRPVGAFLFGAMAEKYGRRPTLMVNVISFSVFELASAFAPGLTSFLICRALFGIAMGGEWGVGAALALETLPAEGRGFFSGLLQEGYVTGSLLAAALYGLLFPHLHGHGVFTPWRVMFMIGALPAVLAFYVRLHVKESPAWLESKLADAAKKEKLTLKRVKEFLPAFLFLIVLMTAFTSFSHGTQDLYPTFLEHDQEMSPARVGLIVAIGNVGALLGGICFGSLSEKIGRRKAIIWAALLSIPMVPLWAWTHSVALLAVGGFLLQFMVQGAWGVIPAHLNELSPGPVRGGVSWGGISVGEFAVFAEQRVSGSVREPVFGRHVEDCDVGDGSGRSCSGCGRVSAGTGGERDALGNEGVRAPYSFVPKKLEESSRDEFDQIPSATL